MNFLINNKYLTQIISFLKSLEFNLKTISLLSLILLNVSMTFYAVLVFQQFTAVKIITVSFIFLFLLFFLFFLFEKKFYKYFIPIKINLKDMIASFILFFGLLLVFFNQADWLSDYYSTYPLLETDLGLFWHEDTAYHTSLIQSIINFGFPSIGQHDALPTFYHVLSHYIDALIIILSDIDVYDSYGLLFFFKKILLISSIVIMILRLSVTHKIAPLYFYLLLLAAMPAIIYTWHAVGSHGLWFSSILLIFTLPNIFNILIKDSIKNLDYIFIFFTIVLITLGKVSSGFMYGSFLGAYLMFRNYKDLRVYALGFCWILFFTFIVFLMRYGVFHQNAIPFIPYQVNLLSFLLDSSNDYFFNLLNVYIFTVLFALFGWYWKSKLLKSMFFSTVFSLFVLCIIVQFPFFSIHDIWYFTYGLYSSILLLFIFTFIYEIHHFDSKKVFKNKISYLFFIVILLVLPKPFNQKYYSIEKAFSNMYQASFQKLNSTYDSNSKYYSIKKLFFESYKINFPDTPNGLSHFRTSLYSYMQKNHLTKRNTLLYIPKHVFEEEITQKEWAKGMLIYSVLGVPLIYGLGDLRSTYGYGTYHQDALRKNENELDLNSICKNEKTIIIINSFSKKNFKMLCIENYQ